MNLGFIGLGIMGTPMALHLMQAGHTLHVHTRSRLPEAIAASPAVACANAAEVARRADIVFVMVPDTADVEAVDHILARAQAHGVVAGIHNGSPEAALKRIAKGFQFVTVSSDARLMAAGAQQVMARMRAGQAAKAPGGY